MSKIEDLKQEANTLSVQDLNELAEFCTELADSIEEEQRAKHEPDPLDSEEE